MNLCDVLFFLDCGTQHASDVSRAAPEISVAGLTSAVTLVTGALLILTDRRSHRVFGVDPARGSHGESPGVSHPTEVL